MSILIVDYGMGNTGSIANMLRKGGVESTVSGDVAEIAKAKALILPGVGHFNHAMGALNERGLVAPLTKKVMEEKAPVLGICLGMQLMGQHSEEGDVRGLGWVNARTVKFPEIGLRLPHMGWNVIGQKKPHAIFDGDGFDERRFYFVHNYHVVCDDKADVLATTQYGMEVTAAVAHENIVGCQFHPEKSHKFGLSLLSRWAKSLA